MLDLTVIIPVYNRRSSVLETLESVALQTHPVTRIIVADDGSTDGTPDVVAQWCETHRPAFEAKLIRGRKQTAAAARRDAFAQMEPTPLVAFLDSDDCWPPDFLERTAVMLQANPDAAAVSTDRQFVDSRGLVLRSDRLQRFANQPIPWIFRHGGGLASCSLFRTSAIAAAGNWDPALVSAEDSSLFCDVAIHGRWLHASGQPVTFSHGKARSRGEDPNLSLRYPDKFRRWAITYEKIYGRIGTAMPRIQRRRLSVFVAGYWYRAGKEFQLHSDLAAAEECYASAIQWHSLHWRARWRRRQLSSHWTPATGTP